MAHIAKSSLPVQGKNRPSPPRNVATSLTGPGYSPFMFIDPEPEKVPAESCLLVHNSAVPGITGKKTITGSLISNQQDAIWLDVFSQDIKFRRSSTGNGLSQPAGDRPGRGAISCFSKKSQARLEHLLRNEHFRAQSSFCLTYHNNWPVDGRICKRQLDNFHHCCRRKLAGIFWGSCWVIEFQYRGAPHFHLFFTFPVDREFGLWMAKTWNRITSGGPGHLYWHSRAENFRAWDHRKGNAYASKNYMTGSKAHQKEIPAEFLRIGRWWGNTRNMAPKAWRQDFSSLLKDFNSGNVNWTEKQTRNYILRTFRKLYDAKVRAQRNHFTAKGEKFKGGKFKQTGCWLGKGDWRTVTVKDATKYFHRLIQWARINGPPDSDMLYAGNKTEVPF